MTPRAPCCWRFASRCPSRRSGPLTPPWGVTWRTASERACTVPTSPSAPSRAALKPRRRLQTFLLPTDSFHRKALDLTPMGCIHGGAPCCAKPFPTEEALTARLVQSTTHALELMSIYLGKEQTRNRFVVMTDGDTFTARSVIVATGAYHRAHIPAFASDLLPTLVQRPSSEYRNPGALPSGSVLVVGAGNSGARSRWNLPNRAAPPGCRPPHGLHPPTTAGPRCVRLAVVDGDAPIHRLVGGSQTDGRRVVHRRSADRLLAPRLIVPTLTTVGRRVERVPPPRRGRVLEDVCTVVWCTGFRADFRWIQLPVFGPEGYPDRRRGIVAAAPGALASLDCGTNTESARRCSAACAKMPSTSSGSCPRTIKTLGTLTTGTKRRRAVLQKDEVRFGSDVSVTGTHIAGLPWIFGKPIQRITAPLRPTGGGLVNLEC